MEETKRLKDALRLRDAYILFFETIKDWGDVSDLRICDDSGDDSKYWNFFRNVDIDVDREESYELDSFNIVFMMGNKYMTPIIAIASESEEIKDRMLEILKDYKDLIE